MIGSTISHYRITGKLGAGGMGEVYRATDSKLDREVAIKVLPESFAQDKERLARFEREAKLLASLDHPNIGAILGVEDADGKRCLILQLIEGETLTERLRTGAMPIDEALDICKQIAEALEAAHEKGIIHRDLKPGNVKITPDGKVKVLDFGLAKAAIADSSVVPSDNSQSPTLTADYTRPGVILGTAAYMSPEQARAKPVDKRSDIWSFGCVLYECLAGKCLFRGEDATETLARVLEREPDWSLLPLRTPATILHLLRRCLTKDKRNRLQDIGSARVEVEDSNSDIEAASLLTTQSQSSRDRSRFKILAIVALVFAGAFLLLWLDLRLQMTELEGELSLARSEKAQSQSEPSPGLAPLLIKVIQLKHSNATNVVPAVSGAILDTRTEVTAYPQNNQLILSATEDELKGLTNLIAQLDSPSNDFASNPSGVSVIGSHQHPTSIVSSLPNDVSLFLQIGGSIAFSPNGDYLAFIGLENGVRRVYKWRLTTIPAQEPEVITGTDNAMSPFFSPDGRWIAFFAEQKLQKVSVFGGSPVSICDVPYHAKGGTWGDDDRIVFSGHYHLGLFLVEKGIVTPLTTPTEAKNENGHMWPEILPGGKKVIYTAWDGADLNQSKTVLRWLDSDKEQVILPQSAFARYISTGHLLFIREGSVWSVPIDLTHPGMETISEAPTHLVDVGQTLHSGAQFAVAREVGSITYAQGNSPLGYVKGSLVWVERQIDGQSFENPIADSAGQFYSGRSIPRISPDGKSVLVHLADKTNLQLFRFERGDFEDATSLRGFDGGPVWVNDNEFAFFNQGTATPPQVYIQSMKDRTLQPLPVNKNANHPSSFSKYGNVLLMGVSYVNKPGQIEPFAGGSDIWHRMSTNQPTALHPTENENEWDAQISPDGKWIAYVTDKRGQAEVWVMNYPYGERRFKVSTTGGAEPAWGAWEVESGELFFRNNGWMMRAEFSPEGNEPVSKPIRWFRDDYLQDVVSKRNYDVTRDGRRFLMIKENDTKPSPVNTITIVSNFFTELNKLVPVDQN